MNTKAIIKNKEEWQAIARGLLEMQKAYLFIIHESGTALIDSENDAAVAFIADLAKDLLKKEETSDE